MWCAECGDVTGGESGLVQPGDDGTEALPCFSIIVSAVFEPGWCLHEVRAALHCQCVAGSRALDEAGFQKTTTR